MTFRDTPEREHLRAKGREIVGDVVSNWQQNVCPTANLELALAQINGRVLTWIGPRSVLAGVTDILATLPATSRPTDAQIDLLCNELSQALLNAGLLSAQPRKAGMLA